MLTGNKKLTIINESVFQDTQSLLQLLQIRITDVIDQLHLDIMSKEPCLQRIFFLQFKYESKYKYISKMCLQFIFMLSCHLSFSDHLSYSRCIRQEATCHPGNPENCGEALTVVNYLELRATDEERNCPFLHVDCSFCSEHTVWSDFEKHISTTSTIAL